MASTRNTSATDDPGAGSPRRPDDRPAAGELLRPARAGLDRWNSLKAAAARCRECPLGAWATQTVWGEGPLQPPLMLVGEQPGDHEDRVGRPFVGPAGHLLERALAELGWVRDALYLTNAVKHFKYELRGKRRMHKTPAQQEVLACHHWLEREIEAVRPRAVVALGATAARSLLRRPVRVMVERGKWFARPDGLRVLVTLHPSALLRGDPEDREQAYAAWLQDLAQASEVWRGMATAGT